MQIPYFLCVDCIHLDLKNKTNGRTICKAYPNGIPKEVVDEKSKPNANKDKPCKNGVKFKHD